jgi:hypothetical protein
MNEEQLRSLVREAIARNLGSGLSAPTPTAHVASREAASGAILPAGSHASHGVFVLPAGNDSGGCLIEPSVRCTHCGYCKSMGH